MNDKEFKQLEKDILAGKYKDSYLPYSRKSTDDTDSQKNSITFQKKKLKDFCSDHGLAVAPITIKGFISNGYISEKHSAFKDGGEFTVTEDGQMMMQIERPKFQKLLHYLSKGYFKGAVFYCWDRASRNPADGVAIKKLISSGVDMRFVIADYDQSSAGALHMDVDDMFSQHHSRVTSEKVTANGKQTRKDGKVNYRAPIGYINEGNVDWKPLDPERAPIIAETFHMYATGDWTLSDIAFWCNEQGLRTVPMRRKRTQEEMLAEEEDEVTIEKVSRLITFNSVSRWLKSPFYIGMTLDEHGDYKKSASHEPLIDEKTFNRVQEQLNKKKVSKHYTDKLDLLYRGMIRCKDCERAFCPYEKKNHLYLGLKCKKDCTNTTKSINEDFIQEQVGEILTHLYFTDSESEQIDAHIKNDLAVLEQRREKQLERNERRKKTIREKLAYLRTEKLNLLQTGAYTAPDYMEESKVLEDELLSLQTEEQISDEAMSATVKDILKLSELVKNISFYWEHLENNEKETITRLIFSELYVMDNVVSFQCSQGFKAFETRLLSFCDPTGNRTPISRMKT